MEDLQTPKEHALRVLDRLPDDASMEFILYEIYFITKVRRGLADLDAGRTISNDEMMARLDEWLHRLQADPQARLT